jgi:hypothetical protein
MTSVAARYTAERNGLSWEFLTSEFAGDDYMNWPIERRLDAYLRHHELMDVLNSGAAYRSLLECVMANIGPANRRGILGLGASEANHATTCVQTTMADD